MKCTVCGESSNSMDKCKCCHKHTCVDCQDNNNSQLVCLLCVPLSNDEVKYKRCEYCIAINKVD